jgi:hypothetical protein
MGCYRQKIGITAARRLGSNFLFVRTALDRQGHPGPYRCLASAFAHLGRDAEAREAAARMLEISSSC